MASPMIRKCHSCESPWEGEGRPGFKATCESCGAFLHSCKNCRLHDPTAHNQCLSPTTDAVSDREGLNWCDEFDFRASDGPKGETDPDAAKNAWDNLFDS